MSERNLVPLILTAVGSVAGTIAALGYYGYLHFAKPEDALLLSDYTMLKTIPGEDYRVSLKPAEQVAQCIDGVLVLFEGPDRRAGRQQEARGALHGPGDPGGRMTATG